MDPPKHPFVSIAIHGRGGQGAVTAANMLVKAAYSTGKYPHVMAFPLFGPERRGAPVSAYARVSTLPIHDRDKIYMPDVVIVMDPSIFKSLNPISAIKDEGLVLVNTTRDPGTFRAKQAVPARVKLGTVDIVAISLELGLMNGSEPVVNTPVLGAFSAMFDEIPVDTMVDAIKGTFKNPAKADLNARAAMLAHDRVAIQ